LIACAKEDSTPTNDQNNDNGQNSDPLLTYVPDDNFEQALIDLGYDDVLDDYVLTQNIIGVEDLFIREKGISDLTGIEDFEALIQLSVGQNNLSSLDVTQNTALTDLRFYVNSITSIDLSQNMSLRILSCDSNNLTSLDVSQNPALTQLWCPENNLTFLNVANGNNSNFTLMRAFNNPDLNCIQIDQGFTPPTGGSWQKDPNTIYSTNCN